MLPVANGAHEPEISDAECSGLVTESLKTEQRSDHFTMSFPPPPPPSQPPQGNPGGYGPPAGGYVPSGQGQGGYGPGGYGPPAGGNQPPGGFGPPAGGYGPPGPGGPGGPGGWQQPPGPPGGGGNGKTIAAIIGAGVVVLAAVITVIVVNTGGGSSNNRAQSPGSSAGASPSESASATPSDAPTPAGTPTDSAFESSTPTPTDTKIPFYLLTAGDCYDRPPGGGGNNDKASCNGPHDAEVVTTHRLASGLTNEAGIRAKASSLCRNELESKAARQPAGTAEGTFVQYPTLDGYKIGIRTINCSLAGNSTGTKKLTKPLS